MGTIITVLVIAAIVLAAMKRIIHDNKRETLFPAAETAAAAKEDAAESKYNKSKYKKSKYNKTKMQ